MTWSLNASGHTPASQETVTGQESPGWADVEQELFGELQAVLSKPKYGTANSVFHGNYVDGEPHRVVEETEPAHTSEGDANPV